MTAQSVRKNGMKSSEELRAVWKMKLKANSHTIYRWEGNEITSLMVLVARIEETCAEVKRLGEKQWLPVRTKDETGEKPSEMVAKVLGFVEGSMAENLLNTGPILAEGDGSSTHGGDTTIEVLQAVRDGQNQMIATMAALTEAITAALPVAPVVTPAVPPVIAQPPPAAAAAAAANPLQNPVQNPQNPQTGGPAPLTGGKYYVMGNERKVKRQL
ncbi:hypothetical protein RHGRI_030960 [Rhododendron griersonianum]|uniref:Uncharacterized protein n=1 Tax=Rhododendron griersonianum TaxID=479676 RepID=A0AAV6I643_9ERIC|nr:hypothetical protein RHGRI_030960 [Rhododendron griersonianum]